MGWVLVCPGFWLPGLVALWCGFATKTDHPSSAPGKSLSVCWVWDTTRFPGPNKGLESCSNISARAKIHPGEADLSRQLSSVKAVASALRPKGNQVLEHYMVVVGKHSNFCVLWFS